jgi:hypothetical protein
MPYTVRCSKQEVREGLSEFIRDKADFRRRKAEQYPQDAARNIRSAKELETVAAFLYELVR